MKTVYAKLTSKGQLTLPAALRDTLGLSAGDRVALSIREEDGTYLVLRPVGSVVDALYASVEPRARPEDFAEQRRAFEDGVAKEVVEELG
jgi:antitoxin PrlF